MASFPERVYTEEEVKVARAHVQQGHKHNLRVEGSAEFKQKVKETLALIKTAGYHDFLRTYIRDIVEIKGFSQLREAEVAIWADKELLKDTVDAAGFFVQKAQQMKDFLEGKPFYGGLAEANAVKKRREFLASLKDKSNDPKVKQRCQEILRNYVESAFF
jgi:hypothetical protein